MTDADRPAFARIVTAIAELKGRELSPEALEEYFGLVRGLTLGQFETAFRAVAARGRYFPDPSEVIESAPLVTTLEPEIPDAPIACALCQDRGYVLTERAKGAVFAEPCRCRRGDEYNQGTRRWSQAVKARARRDHEQQRRPGWQQGGEDFQLEAPE